MAREKMRKPSGLKQDGSPNIAWAKFSERINNFESVPIDNWKAEEIFGYICKRYKDLYGMDFTLSFSGPPTKCRELYIVNRMMATVGSKMGWVLRDYVDYVFDTIIIPKNMKLTSLGLFFTQNICNQYKLLFNERNKVTKNSTLPKEYANIVNSLGINGAETYGDLTFMYLAIKNQPEREDYKIYIDLFSRLKEAGFSESILEAME